MTAPTTPTSPVAPPTVTPIPSLPSGDTHDGFFLWGAPKAGKSGFIGALYGLSRGEDVDRWTAHPKDCDDPHTQAMVLRAHEELSERRNTKTGVRDMVVLIGAVVLRSLYRATHRDVAPFQLATFADGLRAAIDRADIVSSGDSIVAGPAARGKFGYRDGDFVQSTLDRANAFAANRAEYRSHCVERAPWLSGDASGVEVSAAPCKVDPPVGNGGPWTGRLMCSVWEKAAAFAIAAKGLTSIAFPSTRRKPAGVFIHALAMTTKMPDMTPLTATTRPANKCAPRLTRSQPYR